MQADKNAAIHRLSELLSEECSSAAALGLQALCQADALWWNADPTAEDVLRRLLRHINDLHKQASAAAAGVFHWEMRHRNLERKVPDHKPQKDGPFGSLEQASSRLWAFHVDAQRGSWRPQEQTLGEHRSRRVAWLEQQLREDKRQMLDKHKDECQVIHSARTKAEIALSQEQANSAALRAEVKELRSRLDLVLDFMPWVEEAAQQGAAASASQSGKEVKLPIHSVRSGKSPQPWPVIRQAALRHLDILENDKLEVERNGTRPVTTITPGFAVGQWTLRVCPTPGSVEWCSHASVDEPMLAALRLHQALHPEQPVFARCVVGMPDPPKA